ncbi:helix-turn-helix domain-containing protein [Chondromyces crocatus]|uniref:AraC family transcriptional regulator n=1 Tax=Chondromyces crocatus TaxID=52 RepID=A0A0K1EMX0_CHOCO|nr:helix-turn-helix domain-containing protein [Chondromyces crocatus]AKT42245.1 AraC family transcriptional regulator [Chondromyces crocatus]
MSPSTPRSTYGILNPRAGFEHFRLVRHAPSPALAAWIDWIWCVDWDLPAPFEQEVLPHPCVNLVFESAFTKVHGVGTRRSLQRLEGRGWVLGVKFRPGGFYPFSRVPMRALKDRSLALDTALVSPDRAPTPALLDPPEPLESPAAHLERRVRALRGGEGAVSLVEAFFASLHPADEPGLREIMELALRAQQDHTLTRAEDLAKLAGTSLRSLHRAFDRYVGVGPKWVIRRARVHEAAERVAHGEHVAWAALASELGFHDQAHLIRDFKALVGATPAAYAARCREAAAARAPRPDEPPT